MKPIFILLLLSLPSLAQEGPCTITRVVDGDTFHCESEGKDMTIRLIGVDTPELPISEGITAKYITESHIPVGTVVKLELDVQPLDYFRRTLAYVYLPDGTMLNEELLREGAAMLMTVPPNVAYSQKFVSIVKETRSD